MTFIRPILLLLLTAAFVLAGCDASTGPEVTTESPSVDDEIRTPEKSVDADMLAIAGELPGFGGMYYDGAGTLRVHMAGDAAKTTTPEHVESVISSVVAPINDIVRDERNKSLQDIQVEVVPATYAFTDLVDIRNEMAGALTLDGVHTLDVDERANRVRIAAEGEFSLLDVERYAKDLGVDVDAIQLEDAPIPFRAATLRDRIRPVEGGLQIAFDSNLCTLGFIAIRDGVRGFVTNAHCSTSMFTVTPTYYYQPSRTSSNYIGYETVDPALYNSSYRYSDAAFVRLTSSVSSSLGLIARTTGWSYQTGSGSLTIDSSSPHIEIDSEKTSITVGSLLDKIGRTTGWTYGEVENTCQTINMGSYTLYCQDEVYANVGGGDSGSPVFSWKGDTDGDGLDNADLVGVLWGGRTYPSGKKTFLLSRINYVETDLGSLTTR